MPPLLEELKLKLKTVAIVGRVNVGKSTLFNRLIEREKAITSEIAGTTRDQNRGICEWIGEKFYLIDTAGFEDFKRYKAAELETNVQKQIELAMKEADLIYFVVDSRNGILPEDKIILKNLQKSKKPFLTVVNKADSAQWRNSGSEFFQLGTDELVMVSGKTGSGTGDLLDKTIEVLFPENKKDAPEQLEHDFSIAIVGKPNVGKSSLVNSLLGYERSVVSPVAHTTREPLDTLVQHAGKNILLLDTAGIRKRNKRGDELELQSVSRGLRAIKDADICLFLIDATSSIDFQDKKIAGQIIGSRSSVVFIVNKWDIAKEEYTQEEYEALLRKSFRNLAWAPVLFVSAKTKLKVHYILKEVISIIENRSKVISDRVLERTLKKLIKIHKIPAKGGKNSTIPYLYGIKQKSANPPYFELTVEKKQNMPVGLTHVIAKTIREDFKYTGTPVLLHVRSIKK